MSNTRTPKAKPNSLEAYRAKAEKSAANKGPFVFWIDDDTKLEIPRPKGAEVMAVEEARSSREVISILAGEHADELLAVFEAEDFAVMQAVSEDMQHHFGLNQA